MSGQPIDFASYMEPVARRLLGDPNPRMSSADELRFGSHGSTSVRIRGDKRGTFYDHEAGVGGGVLDLLNHRLGLANGEAAAWLQAELDAPSAEKHKDGKKSRHIAATYDYTDEEGEILFQALRYEPKAFNQRRPDGRGGWLYDLHGVRLVLYRLPDLLSAIADGKTVHIVEGEKDVDNLIRLGFAATCNPMGAGKWRPDFAELFRGADIVVIPDNDEPGRKHAREISVSLLPRARQIRWLDLPNQGLKHDVSNWLERGGTAAELLKLTAAAEVLPPPNRAKEPCAPSGDSGLGEWDVGTDTAAIPPRAWLLGNVFCRRFVSSLLAGGGVGKTALRILQLLSLAIGRSLTGDHVFQRCRVLIVSLEDDADELRRRVKAAMLHYKVSPEEVRGWLFLAAPGAKGWKLAITENGAPARAELATRLNDTIRKHAIDIVSIDPLIKSHAVEENANGAIDFVANILSALAIERNCAVDAPHHVKKGDTEAGNADAGRGAGAFKDAARLVYTLKPMSEDEAKTFGLPEGERRRLIRVDSGKVNIAPAAATAKWFRLVGVPLGNATELYPQGDEVQTVEPWTPPDLWQNVSAPTANAILTEIDSGLPNGALYSDHNRAARCREAHLVVQRHVDGLNEKQARAIIKTWLGTGLLYHQAYHDKETRRERNGLRVDNSKRPG